MGILTPCRITTHQNFILKFGTRIGIAYGTLPDMHISGKIGPAGGFPKIREI